MTRTIKKKILNLAKRHAAVTAAQVAALGGFSRVYASRLLNELRSENRLIRAGKANQSKYFLPTRARQALPSKINMILKNRSLQEDQVMAEIKNQTSIFPLLAQNIRSILEYAFTEILNNAIEHSASKIIKINFEKNLLGVKFVIRDFGVGVFKKIMKQFRLHSEVEAINHVLKGKQTTAPKAHSGEGIFFTSKVADVFLLESFGKKLEIDNIKNNAFVKNIKPLKGTRATFVVNPKAKKNLRAVFSEYSGKSFEFSKTKVLVRLGIIDSIFLSRSQARRIVFGLEKFKQIILDFTGVESVGQSFADEIFRIWQANHPHIKITTKNANENSLLMIKRSQV